MDFSQILLAIYDATAIYNGLNFTSNYIVSFQGFLNVLLFALCEKFVTSRGIPLTSLIKLETYAWTVFTLVGYKPDLNPQLVNCHILTQCHYSHYSIFPSYQYSYFPSITHSPFHLLFSLLFKATFHLSFFSVQ